MQEDAGENLSRPPSTFPSRLHEADTLRGSYHNHEMFRAIGPLSQLRRRFTNFSRANNGGIFFGIPSRKPACFVDVSGAHTLPIWEMVAKPGVSPRQNLYNSLQLPLNIDQQSAMKFSQATLLALATAAVANGSAIPAAQANAAPVAFNQDQLISALQNLNAVLDEATTHKRELTAEEIQLATRDLGLAISGVISAFINLGILGDIWNTITTDQNLRDQIVSLAKLAIAGLFAALPNLLSAIWNSGLLQNIFSKLVNDQGLQQALLNLVKEAFLAILGYFTGGSSSSSSTPQQQQKRAEMVQRDIGDIISSIFNWITNWVQQNPEAFQNFLTTAINFLAQIGGTLFNWLQTSGIWDSIMKWIGENSGGIVDFIVKLLGGIFGSLLNPQASQAVADLQTAAALALAKESAQASATGGAAATATATGGSSGNILSELLGGIGGGASSAAASGAAGAASVASAATSAVGAAAPAISLAASAAATAATGAAGAAGVPTTQTLTVAAAATGVPAPPGAGVNAAGAVDAGAAGATAAGNVGAAGTVDAGAAGVTAAAGAGATAGATVGGAGGDVYNSLLAAYGGGATQKKKRRVMY